MLIFLIIITQLLYFFLDFSSLKNSSNDTDSKWLLVQSEIDSLNVVSKQEKFKITPFNPNFISDYKGYLLGMSVKEIDRLHQFRLENKFVNSAKEFQNVTKVSDSLLKVISPYFKFPDWVNDNKKHQSNASHKFYNKSQDLIVQKDINTATKEELMAIYGIGDKISDIILQERDKFGAFVSMDQLEYVWGVSPEVLSHLRKRFFVNPNAQIIKYNINNLPTKELAKFPYFRYNIAKEIVTYRSMNGDFKSVDDLTKIKGMPNEKIKIIALYLEF